MIYLVDVPKGAQTEFRVGMPTNLHYDATGEYYRLGLVNYMFGASPSSRLFQNLRENKGWTYGVSSNFTGSEYAGGFTLSSGIRADATDSALVEVMKEIKKYNASGITEDEMKFMKTAIALRDARSYETGAQKLQFVGRILQYDLPSDYISKQNDIVKNIKKNEIDALAKKWLDADKINIVLVGDKAKILPGLQKMGYDIVELDVEGNKK